MRATALDHPGPVRTATNRVSFSTLPGVKLSTHNNYYSNHTWTKPRGLVTAITELQHYGTPEEEAGLSQIAREQWGLNCTLSCVASDVSNTGQLLSLLAFGDEAGAADAVYDGISSVVRDVIEDGATEDEAPLIKAGSSGGPTAGKAFPQSVRQAALDENPSTCVFCRMETDTPQVDHAIARANGGNATLDNAQTACPFCNASKGARDFPVNPPPGYEGPFPPPWWDGGGGEP